MPTSFALTPHFEAFIQKQLASGSYNNASEVVREGLRLLERQQKEDAAKLQALREAAKVGFGAIDAGDFVDLAPEDIDAVISQLAAEAPPAPARRRGTKARR